MAVAATIGAVGGAATSYLGGRSAKKSAKKAAKLQYQAAMEGLALQRELYTEAKSTTHPFVKAGREGVRTLRDMVMPGGELAREFTAQDFQEDPGYQFRLEEGMKALERSASARGRLASGGSMKDMTRFGQGLAAQEYGSAFDRFQQNRAMRFNQLMNLTNVGLQGIGMQQGARQNFANQGSELITQGGNALAAGVMGAEAGRQQQIGAIGQLFQGAGNAYMMRGGGQYQQLLQGIMGSGTSPVSTPPTAPQAGGATAYPYPYTLGGITARPL